VQIYNFEKFNFSPCFLQQFLHLLSAYRSNSKSHNDLVSDSGRASAHQNVKREKFQFSNTETRVLLALVTFSVTTAVLAGGMIMWIFTPAWDNGGIKLVEVLPVLRNKEIKRMRRGVWNDLIYLLSLVHVNRFRSLELRIAFYVLAVSEQLPADDGDDSSVESRKKKFIKLMMELMAWPSDSDEGVKSRMESIADNLV
jgi:hypothetical protein